MISDRPSLAKLLTILLLLLLLFFLCLFVFGTINMAAVKFCILVLIEHCSFIPGIFTEHNFSSKSLWCQQSKLQVLLTRSNAYNAEYRVLQVFKGDYWYDSWFSKNLNTGFCQTLFKEGLLNFAWLQAWSNWSDSKATKALER